MASAVECEWMTAAQIADHHRVDRRTVIRWITTGLTAPSGKRVLLVATKIANEWRVMPADLDAFLVALRSVPLEEPRETAAEVRRRGEESTRRVLERLG